MRSFLASVVVAIVVAISAMYLLDYGLQHRADEAFTSSPSVRGPVHGNTHNLVGRDWYSARDHGWTDEGVPTANALATPH